MTKNADDTDEVVEQPRSSLDGNTLKIDHTKPLMLASPLEHGDTWFSDWMERQRLSPTAPSCLRAPDNKIASQYFSRESLRVYDMMCDLHFLVVVSDEAWESYCAYVAAQLGTQKKMADVYKGFFAFLRNYLDPNLPPSKQKHLSIKLREWRTDMTVLLNEAIDNIDAMRGEMMAVTITQNNNKTENERAIEKLQEAAAFTVGITELCARFEESV